ncbi:MAG: hypothetical protein KKD73_14340, partial [Proteobacteria bacterium]|nr:hypothetical protein [Pseudomonadota bacterium]
SKTGNVFKPQKKGNSDAKAPTDQHTKYGRNRDRKAQYICLVKKKYGFIFTIFQSDLKSMR